MSEIRNQKERDFIVELDSRSDLKKVNLEEGSQERVLIQGTIGKLIEAKFEEEVVLEIMGEHGSLRIDLQRNDIKLPKIREGQK